MGLYRSDAGDLAQKVSLFCNEAGRGEAGGVRGGVVSLRTRRRGCDEAIVFEFEPKQTEAGR
jgi:hypothetical protein